MRGMVGEGRVGRKGCVGRDERKGWKGRKTDRRKKIDGEELREKGGERYRSKYYVSQMTQFNTVDPVERQRKHQSDDLLDGTSCVESRMLYYLLQIADALREMIQQYVSPRCRIEQLLQDASHRVGPLKSTPAKTTNRTEQLQQSIKMQD